LGFKKEKTLLKELKINSGLPVIINLKYLDSQLKKSFGKESQASDIYYTIVAAKTGAAAKKGAEFSKELAITPRQNR
jgi:hypothetical protein